ncbi:SUMF1/EgtB/PvdO family nonheme iron enzyme, partial [bacterium]|nr:SUMF1/EgtB/PvdO family nonheme iron enzyme [bacterium]
MRIRTLSLSLNAAILTVALVAFVPVAFGQAGNSGGDTLSKELSLDLGKGVSMKLVHIPAGKFKMGNHDTPAETIKKVGGEEEHVSDEYPAHEVTISKPFYMGIYELTQAQWKAVMGTEPWLTKSALAIAGAQPRPEGFDDYPAVWMNSYDAIEFCRKLSKKTGMSVTLPTEAQWEYACRAGSTTTFSFGDDLSKLIDYGWYGGLGAGQKEDYAHRVGQLKPNPWGLYDMHGNVWEFCSDWYDKDFYSRSPSVDPENTTETDLRCLRSGSFHSVPAVSRSSQRARWVGPKQVRYNYGMRVVVTADAQEKSDGDTNRPGLDKIVQSMFYKAQHQETGNMWDVWLYHHSGTYFLYYLANVGEHRWRWDNISMATSPDGVHWTERGPILKKTPGAKWMGTGSTWKSPTFEQDGKFYMNYSEEFDGRQNIYFAESTDLLNWTRLEGEEYRFVQNEQWYKKKGRWDCIWTIPKPGGGLYGYWTASPDRSKKEAADGIFGFGESLDGVHWKALAPPRVIDDENSGEVGAVEKIGGKYYMLFGHYPAMTTLVADSPEGPFRKAKKNYKVLTGHTYFSRFFRHPEGMLACHFTQARDVQVSFAPIKDVRIDHEGALRFGWWKENEKMKHRPIAVERPLDSKAAVALLGNSFDTKQGIILEGTLKLPKAKDSPRCGVYIECKNNLGVGVLIDSTGVAELGPMKADGKDFKAEKRVDREMTFDSPAAFRLLLRGSLMEFYLDDILI